MATYTVIQDIEAEDKLLGPLSLRQFLYAVIALVSGFLVFRLTTIHPLLGLPLVPIIFLFGFLAAPFGHDQSSEIWLLAKIRFILKPRRRIWDQAGLQELVTITVPKKIERVLTNGLSEHEVRSRLRALADTIDTRGWVVKGLDVNLSATPGYMQQSSDRLLDVNAVMPQEVPDVEVHAVDDLLDAYNPVAQHMGQLVQTSTQAHRDQIMQQMQQIRDKQAQQGAPISQPQAVSMPAPVSAPATSALDEGLITQQLKSSRQKQQSAYGHTPVLQPTQPAAKAPVPPAVKPVTEQPQPGILELSRRDDFTVDTIARQARKDDGPQDEVVISLH